MPRVLVANAGTIRVFRVSELLQEHGMLARCATTFHLKQRWLNLIPGKIGNQVRRATTNRQCASIDAKVWTYFWPEFAHLVGTKLLGQNEQGWIKWRNHRFGKKVAQKLLDDIDLVWSFDTASSEIFSAAKQRGIICILDVCIAHPVFVQQIATVHAKLRPEYAADLDMTVDLPFIKKREREMELADRIVVGSSFVERSLVRNGVSAAKIDVNPYGVNLAQFKPSAADAIGPMKGACPVRFLYVGSFTQRKGLYDLIEAWVHSQLALHGATLTLIGGTRNEIRLWSGELPPGISILARLPHAELAEQYSMHDIFVFPSLYEGFAKVILEAMACGLPIITTPNACDASAVVNGVNGRIVKVGCIESLCNAMLDLFGAAEDRQAYSQNSYRMSQNFTWDSYGERCAEICLKSLRLKEIHVPKT